MRRPRTAAGAIRDVSVVYNGSGYTGLTAALNVSCVSPCSGQGLVGVCRVAAGGVVAVDVLQQGAGYSPQHLPNLTCAGGAVEAVLQPTVSERSYLAAEGGGLYASYYDNARWPGPPAFSTTDGVVDFSHARLLTPGALENDGSFSGSLAGPHRAWHASASQHHRRRLCSPVGLSASLIC